MRCVPSGARICRAFVGAPAIELWRRASEALVEMHIVFERTGGFAGIHVGCEINTDNLTTEAASEVAAFVDASNFFDLPEVPPTSGPDQFQFKLSIEKDGRMRTIESGERGMPTSLSSLINWLMAAARRGTSH